MPRINFDDLGLATNNWNPGAIIGRGGFATVYRGVWQHTEVAIKCIKYQGKNINGEEALKLEMRSILNELKHLNGCRHKNILPLYAWSYGGGEPCLVYELMAGGSLDTRLAYTRMPLTFQQRVNIAVGTARGIQFLHGYKEKPLIHCDIKPANILLDPWCVPKIGDFGFSREGSFEEMEISTAFGTWPYLPHEFVYNHKLSKKVDTYSFGVVLCVLMTRLLAYDEERGGSCAYLAKHVARIYKSSTSNISSLCDITMEKNYVPSIYRKIIECAIWCTDDNPNARPEMLTVMDNIILSCQTFS